MANIGITRLSSKGQVVIPAWMRKNFNEGDKIVIIENGDQLILKKATDFDKNIEEDLEFAKRTEEAYKRIENGNFISLDSESLFEEMEKW
ncbi:MAG: AbrB/MazE/SpoVT family DNA-binding domain-containing protein [Nanoarchaeota archaeon]|nr:AbrB/MazE/SpoVT family DNA-binding domain-containing protein [Nanoarchaeota archaeon]